CMRNAKRPTDRSDLLPRRSKQTSLSKRPPTPQGFPQNFLAHVRKPSFSKFTDILFGSACQRFTRFLWWLEIKTLGLK
ncbi:MAG TPA: hypothetical protein VE131_13285, partial [Terriglobales bacterium]|nr:hypothetical protein [Terriglobales bacterium]